MIKVAELIEKLQKFDPELPVVTPGFDEGGIDDISDPEIVEIVRNHRHGGFCGKHELIDRFSEESLKTLESVKAVFIDF